MVLDKDLTDIKYWSLAATVFGVINFAMLAAIMVVVLTTNFKVFEVQHGPMIVPKIMPNESTIGDCITVIGPDCVPFQNKADEELEFYYLPELEERGSEKEI